VKFKLDENLSPLLAPLFTSAGHEAHSVVAQSLGGQPDERVIDVCSREQRALVTLDMDFANIQTYPPTRHAGIAVLRIADQAHDQVERAIHQLLAVLLHEQLSGTLWIVEPDRVRIRT
jgi:predicted nuclease of predicted toxin-antitoxin system